MALTVRLAGGASVEFTMDPSFLVPLGAARPREVDQLVDGVSLGFLDVSSGSGFDDPTSFRKGAGFAMFVETEVKHDHKTPLQFGYRQIGNTHFHNYFYAGRKIEDGSIIDGSTGLNRRWFLDPSHNGPPTFLSNTTPFAQELITVQPNKPLVLKNADRPAGGDRLRRMNTLTKTVNYLISARGTAQFFTAFYVVDSTIATSPIAVALEGFLWEYVWDVSVIWSNGIPSHRVQRNRATMVSRFTDNLSRFDGFQVMNVKSAPAGENMTKIINDAMDRARTTGKGDLWQFSTFSRYHPLVDEDVNDAVRRGEFSFGI